MASAAEVGLAFHAWAKENGYLVNEDFESPAHRIPLDARFRTNSDTADLKITDQLLSRIQVAAVFHDEDTSSITICTKGAIPSSRSKGLPAELNGFTVNWIGSCNLQSNPPPTPPQPPATQRSYRHNNRVSCGSSLHPASAHGAGTFGCLVRDAAGTLYGMSNNHVTGGCNHMEEGMPVLSPAAFDASSDPSHPVPETIGRHARSIPLLSGDPRIVPAQVHDAAIFTIIDPTRVSSMQGDGAFDTPPTFSAAPAGMRVKKIGRTTGLTTGTVIGVSSAAIAIPYVADRFKAHVYIGTAFAISGDNNQPFSQPGDSGSLVVTEDELFSLGLIMAGMNNISLALPLEATLTELKVDLVSNFQV